MKKLRDESLKKYSNMKVGGIAKELFIIEKKEELKELLSDKREFFLIGNGTNTLFSDKEHNKIFISLKDLNKIEKLEKGFVKAEAGAKFSKLIDFMRQNNYSGLEKLAGIPGTVGGLVNMNGGAYGSEIFDCIDSVEVLNSENEIKLLKKDKINHSYRTSEIKQKKWIIISVYFNFKDGFKEEEVKDCINKRNERHPLELPNLGSTFKNPEGKFAVKLIINAGLRGFSLGGAQVSEKHPNFVVNKGEASFEDIINLIKEVKEKVYEDSNIKLEEEIIIVN